MLNSYQEITAENIANTCDITGFNEIDFYLADFLAKQETQITYKSNTFLIALLLSNRLNTGTIFIDKELYSQNQHTLANLNLEIFSNIAELDFSKILKSNSVGDVNSNKPIILDGEKLYFNKFFNFQKGLFNKLKNRYLLSQKIEEPFKIQNKKNFTLNENQIEAIKKAYTLPLCIITGGPGTGKTFTIAKLISILSEETTKPLKIALLSLTGKASRRLEEEVQKSLNLEHLESSLFRHKEIFLRISTIHSMLFNKVSYYYDAAKECFLWDYLIIDEASMIDLELMELLLKQTSEKTKLTLVGDNLQLNPIEAGYFFFDICTSMQKHKPFFYISLQENYRFDKEKTETNLIELKNLLSTPSASNLQSFLKKEIFYWITNLKDFYLYIIEQAKHNWKQLWNAKTPEEAFDLYREFIILCALKISPFGAEKINYLLEENLKNEMSQNESNSLWYHGRPIIILVNHRELGLNNGDIGICLKDKHGIFKVHFEKKDPVMPNSLPSHQSAYAFSIHKSQGSEFSEVLICLADKYYEFFTRELLYTALTRAKKQAKIITTKDVINKTIHKNCQPTTALTEKFNKLLAP